MGPPATMAGVRGPSRTLRACCVTTHSEKSPRTPRGHTGVGGCPQQLPPNKRLCPDRPQTDREGRGASDGRKHPRSQVRLSSRHFAGGPVHSSHELVRLGPKAACPVRPEATVPGLVRPCPPRWHRSWVQGDGGRVKDAAWFRVRGLRLLGSCRGCKVRRGSKPLRPVPSRACGAAMAVSLLVLLQRPRGE